MGKPVRKIDLSWSRWNEYTNLRPRWDRTHGIGFTEYHWAWFHLTVTR